MISTIYSSAAVVAWYYMVEKNMSSKISQTKSVHSHTLYIATKNVGSAIRFALYFLYCSVHHTSQMNVWLIPGSHETKRRWTCFETEHQFKWNPIHCCCSLQPIVQPLSCTRLDWKESTMHHFHHLMSKNSYITKGMILFSISNAQLWHGNRLHVSMY